MILSDSRDMRDLLARYLHVTPGQIGHYVQLVETWKDGQSGYTVISCCPDTTARAPALLAGLAVQLADRATRLQQ